MTTRYVRFRGSVEVSDSSDYVNPEVHAFDVSSTCGMKIVKGVVKASALAGPDVTTLDISNFTSVDLLVLRHVDDSVTTTVTVNCRPTGAAAASDVLTLTNLDYPTIFAGINVASNITLISTAATTPEIAYTIVGT